MSHPTELSADPTTDSARAPRGARLGCPDLGVGIGLRVPHYQQILSETPKVDFFEIISENFMVPGGRPRYHLDTIRERYRLVQHGVSLAIGSPTPPSQEYLTRLKALVSEVKPPWVSDHFCWGQARGMHLHDLLPMPYTRAAIERVVSRAKAIQDTLGVRLALENTSSYLTYTQSQMTEWEFISEVAERADIGLMFDVNNVYVSAYNHGFDPYEFIHHVPHHRIVQIHLAGHTQRGTHLLDTHSAEVADPVWDLYRETIELAGPISTLIEWDDDIPPLERVLQEAERARTVREGAVSARVERAARGLNPAPRFVPHAAPVRQVAPAAAPHGAGWSVGGPRELAQGEP